MKEIFADLHVHIGRSENGKPIKITAARSLNFANIAKECADRKGIQMVGIIDCASPYVIEDIETFLKNGDAYEIEDGGFLDMFLHPTVPTSAPMLAQWASLAIVFPYVICRKFAQFHHQNNLA